ncbi:MAG: ferrous iron transporter B, partial [Clostridia bacterium]|nr:ferrous iron transporter B [Clostridia bacterium]
KKREQKLTKSDKIDKVVTNRWLGLPIFAVVMFLVYYIAMVTVDAAATDWANDNLFGDGYHLLGIGSKAYEEKAGDFEAASNALAAYGFEFDPSEEGFDGAALISELNAFTTDQASAETEVTDDETLEVSSVTVYFDSVPADADEETTNGMTFKEAIRYFEEKGFDEPDPAEDGVWVPGVPALIDKLLLDSEGNLRVPEWLYGLIQDGIVAGVGAVLGFVPQMLVLFFLLALLEGCGYMARIAFVLDRIFRRFGLSGKSFIPMLIGTGCGIPGIMASRTIENERDRRMTITTTTFIPCGAKIPFIAMIAGALFNKSPLVSVSAYFIGMAAIIISGIILKKTKRFAGDPAPFVMELPAYHLPTLGNVLRSTWERGWSFIKKAGTIILLSTILVWFTSFFGWVDGAFRMLAEEEMEFSILAHIGKAFAWLFAPLGWGNWKAAVASVTGLVAKENIVGTMGILYGDWAGIASAFATKIAGFSFLVFNLLCAPCFAAIGAIRREMNSAKWTWFAVGYQCGFAYAIALMINQFGNLLTGKLSTGAGTAVNTVSLVAAFAVLVLLVYMLFFKKYKEATKLTQQIKV